MRHVGDRQRHDLGGALAGAGQPAALDPRQMLADDVHLADRRARTQQRAVDLLLLRERNAVGRRDPVRRAAAGQQHQQQIVGGCLGGEAQRFVGGFQSGFVGHGMAGLDHPDPPRRHGVAVARGGKAGQPRGIEPQRIEIVPFGRGRHRGRRPCRRQGRSRGLSVPGRRCADSTTSGCAAATAASKIARKRGRRSVMVCNGRWLAGWGLVIHPIAAKENPRGLPAGALVARKWAGQVFESQLAADVAAHDLAEQLPGFALELLQLDLRDRREVGRRGVDLDARQQAAEFEGP